MRVCIFFSFCVFYFPVLYNMWCGPHFKITILSCKHRKSHFGWFCKMLIIRITMPAEIYFIVRPLINTYWLICMYTFLYTIQIIICEICTYTISILRWHSAPYEICTHFCFILLCHSVKGEIHICLRESVPGTGECIVDANKSSCRQLLDVYL